MNKPCGKDITSSMSRSEVKQQIQSVVDILRRAGGRYVLHFRRWNVEAEVLSDWLPPQQPPGRSLKPAR